MPPARPDALSIDDLKDRLLDRLDEIVFRHFDQTGAHEKAGRRFMLNSTRGDRSVGSFFVTMSGPDKGRWADFAMSPRPGSRASYATGDVLDLLAMAIGTANPADTIKAAREMLGLSTESPEDRARREAAREKRKAEAEAAAAARRKRAARMQEIARAVWLSAQDDIRGTPVDAYLAGRSIDIRALPHLSGAIRFHPACRYYYQAEVMDAATGELTLQTRHRELPAMVTALARGGQIIDCHRTYLQQRPDGSWTKAPVDDAKKVFGDYSGASARLCGALGPRGGHLKLRDAPEGATVFVTEGIENGLSLVALRALTGRPPAFVIAAGAVFNFARVELPDTVSRVVLAADNDQGDHARAALQAAIEAQAAQGREVRVWRSPVPGEDLNDALKRALAAQAERGAA